MAKSKGAETTRPIAVRLPDSLIKLVDGYAAELQAERPGLTVSRNEAIRVLLTSALADKQRAKK